MKKPFIALLLAACTAAPASACFQVCRYGGSGDSCDTVSWVTGTSCYMSGPSCIEVQEICWAPSLAQQLGQEEPEPELACIAP